MLERRKSFAPRVSTVVFTGAEPRSAHDDRSSIDVRFGRLMQWRDGLQLAAIVVLVGIGSSLLVVGAYGSGGLMLLVGAVWFWRLYRTGE